MVVWASLHVLSVTKPNHLILMPFSQKPWASAWREVCVKRAMVSRRRSRQKIYISSPQCSVFARAFGHEAEASDPHALEPEALGIGLARSLREGGNRLAEDAIIPHCDLEAYEMPSCRHELAQVSNRRKRYFTSSSPSWSD